jgi:hypothetical protein
LVDPSHSSILADMLVLTGSPFLQASVEDTSSEDTQTNRGELGPTDSERTITPSQPDLPQSAPRKRPVPEPAAPRASVEAGPVVSPKRARKELQTSSSSQEVSQHHPPCSYQLFFICRFITIYIGKHLPCRRLTLLVGKPGQRRCLSQGWI